MAAVIVTTSGRRIATSVTAASTTSVYPSVANVLAANAERVPPAHRTIIGVS